MPYNVISRKKLFVNKGLIWDKYGAKNLMKHRGLEEDNCPQSDMPLGHLWLNFYSQCNVDNMQKTLQSFVCQLEGKENEITEITAFPKQVGIGIWGHFV